MFKNELDIFLKEEAIVVEELMKQSELEKQINTAFSGEQTNEDETDERHSKVRRVELPTPSISSFICTSSHSSNSQSLPQHLEQNDENVPRNMLDDFATHHHLTRIQVEGLFQVLGPHYSNPGRRAPLKDFVITSLVVLSTRNNYRELNESKLFKSRGWMHKTIHQFCKMMVDHLSETIEWPSGVYAQDTMRDFENIVGLPGVLGALDTCHMPITKAPVGKCSKLYSNPMLFHSIHLLAVVDAKSRFTYINVGRPGSFRESQVLELTSLYQVIENEPVKLFPPNSHLIADSAFPLSDSLITPYPVSLNINREQKNFNGTIYTTRRPADIAFELLRARWKRLRCLEMDEVKSMVNLVKTCCVLHNICLHNDGYRDRNFEQEDKEDMEVEYAGNIPSATAVQKRDMLSMYMNGQTQTTFEIL